MLIFVVFKEGLMQEFSLTLKGWRPSVKECVESLGRGDVPGLKYWHYTVEINGLPAHMRSVVDELVEMLEIHTDMPAPAELVLKANAR